MKFILEKRMGGCDILMRNSFSVTCSFVVTSTFSFDSSTLSENPNFDSFNQ